MNKLNACACELLEMQFQKLIDYTHDEVISLDSSTETKEFYDKAAFLNINVRRLSILW